MNSNVTVAVTLIAVVALGACGGSSQKQLSAGAYKQRIATLAHEDANAHSHFEALPKAKSVGEIRSGLAEFAGAERKLAREVANIHPPEDAAGANRALAQGYRDMAADMDKLRNAISSARSPRAAVATIGKLGPKLKGGPELDAALGRLKKLGYAANG